MSDNTLNSEPIDQNDIWSLADTLPLDQVIAVARERATHGEVAALAFLAMAAQHEHERLSFRRQAAEGGDLHSMLKLAGQSLASGDNAQALIWFERAAAQGSAEAHVRLGMMIAKGQGVTPDPIAAITRICTANLILEKDNYLELVLDEQDYPFDLADKDVYYTHVIERIFSDFSTQDKQQVYAYLHQRGIQPESDDGEWEVAQNQRAREQPTVTTTQRRAAPVRAVVAAHSPSVQTIPPQRGKVRFAPYQYNVTQVRCGNRACAWEGIMTQSDHQCCPVCKRYPLHRVGGWQLLNGSLFAKQRDTLLKKHERALRTVAWCLYATTRDFQALAAVWGNAPYMLDKTR